MFDKIERMISKEDILRHTTTYDILDHFTSHYREGQLKPGKHFQNPLIDRTQRTPSFNIYRSSTGQYMYKDFATGHGGTAFDFVMEKYGLNLSQACKYIAQRLGIEKGEMEVEEQFKPEPQIEADERNYDFKTYPKQWSRHELAFWEQAGITRPILDFLRIRPLKRFWAFNRFNKQYEIKARFDNPIFEYVQNGWSKIYLPFANPKYTSKFYTLGRKDPYYIFGIDQLPYSDSMLAIVGGEKDVAAWWANVGSAICFNSEEANPENYPNFLDIIYSGRFERILFVYDNDETGIRQMKRMTEKFNQFGAEYWIPKGVGEGGDIFNFFENRKREGVN